MTRIVGVGASAGGLAALDLFFAHVAADTGLAFVVVQHMDPTHPAMLVSLLQRVSALPVVEAADATWVAPNTVYVIPPGHELTVAGGCLRLGQPRQPRGLRLPIDTLFRSLAREQQAQAIGVVLSGMGTDGTRGLQAIHRKGGIALAQSPDSAQFSAMPQSAIDSGCVSGVDVPSTLPQHIQAAIVLAKTSSHDADMLSQSEAATLKSIVHLLHDRTKHDLSLYKTSTLLRRIQRRVAVHQLESMETYATFLQENPQELEVLFAEMLIGVTDFFRDPMAWADLQEKVLSTWLSAQRSTASPYRAWVVGCSSGEEAYSLAMAFQEAQDATAGGKSHRLQIFATDVSADVIAVAHKGWYSAKALDGMDEARRTRFFTEQEGGFQISQSIRDKVLFAQHNVILDPPFTKLDLICCRNVLIYFLSELQHRLMPLFHFSLYPGGTLMLGSSETVGRSVALFTPLAQKSRIYRRNDQALGAVDFPVNRHAQFRKPPTETPVTISSKHPPNLQAMADQLLLQTYAPPAVLVNAAGDILYINGRTGRFLEPAAGKANWNIHVMARAGIRTRLAVALHQALQDNATVELTGLRLEDDPSRSVALTVQPVKHPQSQEGMAMVVFREMAGSKKGKPKRTDLTDVSDSAVSLALERAQEELRTLHQEMQASNEALGLTNEELQSTNEELQSANEELTSSKEEGQSMNEELETINGELLVKLNDLSVAETDMQNLLNSIDIATLLLDNDLNIRRFTEQASRIFHLRDNDIGRPLSDLASTLDYPELHADVRDTLETLATSDKQIAAADGRWFAVRIMPYRTLNNTVTGAVLTFVDITQTKELEFRLSGDPQTT